VSSSSTSSANQDDSFRFQVVIIVDLRRLPLLDHLAAIIGGYSTFHRSASSHQNW
jgi:hypothetical protein